MSFLKLFFFRIHGDDDWRIKKTNVSTIPAITGVIPAMDPSIYTPY